MGPKGVQISQPLFECGVSQPTCSEQWSGGRCWRRPLQSDGPAPVQSVARDVGDYDDGAADGGRHLSPHL